MAGSYNRSKATGSQAKGKSPAKRSASKSSGSTKSHKSNLVSRKKYKAKSTKKLLNQTNVINQHDTQAERESGEKLDIFSGLCG